MIESILVYTGSRGEWGYLRPVCDKLRQIGIKPLIIVGNMHVLGISGMTYKEIENDGFEIYEKLYVNIEGPVPSSWCKSLGLQIAELSDLIRKTGVRAVLAAGDRAEMFAFCFAAYYSDLIIFHIQAGERSGHKDGLARHAIGKLAHVHFASNQDSYSRLLDFGEQEFRLHCTGAPQLDDICSHLKSNRKRQMPNALKQATATHDRFAVCIVHGSSDDSVTGGQLVELIASACKKLDLLQVWIMPNNDPESLEISAAINELSHVEALKFRSLPRQQFIDVLASASLIVGNSSAGILEAPSCKTPSVNIGNRQFGRVRSPSVFDVTDISASRILDVMTEVIRNNNEIDYVNAYGDGTSSSKIVKIIQETKITPELRNKYVTR